MYRRITFIACLLAIGCGSATPTPRTAADAAREQRQAQLQSLEQTSGTQQTEIRELEARLALSQAEARDLRSELSAHSNTSPRQTVRIGATSRASEGGWQEPDTQLRGVEPDANESQGTRPVLRLYGSPAARLPGEHGSAITGALMLPPPPMGVPTTLPVAPLPGHAAPNAPVDIGPVATYTGPPSVAASTGTPREGGAQATYRSALELVRSRRFEEALPALGAFVEQHPRHAWAPNAAYWRGESLYALRNYRLARIQFETVLRRWPRSGKVAESLLKIGLCHQRMGNARRARTYFQRVQEQYPNSVAARLASQENAS